MSASPTTIAEAPTLHLLVELAYGGRSGFVPGLVDIEPIPIEQLVAVLEVRHRISFGSDADAWRKWATGESGPLSLADRARYADMMDFKGKLDPLFKRARE